MSQEVNKIKQDVTKHRDIDRQVETRRERLRKNRNRLNQIFWSRILSEPKNLRLKMPRQVSTNNKQTKNQMENKMIKKNSKVHKLSRKPKTMRAARQHCIVICRMTLEIKQRKCVKAQASIKWWKQKKENVTQSSDRSWNRLSVVGKTYYVTGKLARRYLVCPLDTGKRTRRLGEIRKNRKILKGRTKKKWDSQGDKESRQEYSEARHTAKRWVAKESDYSDLHMRLDTKEGEEDFHRVRQREGWKGCAA